MTTNELKVKILNDFVAANATSMSVDPDCFSPLYIISRQRYIEIVDEFIEDGLILPDWENPNHVDWLVIITPKARELINSGVSSLSMLPKGKILKIRDCEPFDIFVENLESMSIRIRAAIKERCLEISGCDVGYWVEKHLGDFDHEYWYCFDEHHNDRLFKILSGIKQERDVKKILLAFCSGIDGLSKLQALCKQLEIRYNYYSY